MSSSVSCFTVVYLDFGVRDACLGLGLVVGGSASTHLNAGPGGAVTLVSADSVRVLETQG